MNVFDTMQFHWTDQLKGYDYQLQLIMNIGAQIRKLDKEANKWNLMGPFGLLGLAGLYGSIFITAFENKPLLAICVSISLAAVVPGLLRWYKIRIERKLLHGLHENPEGHA